MTERPYLYIPEAAEPGQPLSFADRKLLLEDLFRAIVGAGNAVRAGRREVMHRRAVVGYKGVGKSAVIVRALEMLRVPPEGAMPIHDKERWLIFYFSGKHFPSFEALTDAIPGIQLEPESGASSGGVVSSTFMGFLGAFTARAEPLVSEATHLNIVHRYFKQEAALYLGVQQSFEAMRLAVAYVKKWQGAILSRKEDRTDRTERGRDASLTFKAELEGLVGLPSSAVAKAGLDIAAGLLAKHATALQYSEQIEGRWRVGADILVDAFNEFFDRTAAAKLPTIFVMDDLDEFTSATGASHYGRAQMLSHVLGTFNRLRPSVLLVGLRQEYMQEDIERIFTVSSVPPLTPPEARQVLDSWAMDQLNPESMVELKALANKLLGLFPEGIPTIVAFQFLRMVKDLYNRQASSDESAKVLIERYIDLAYQHVETRAISRLAEVMPAEDLLLCATTAPLMPDAYALTESEREVLSKAGLLRPALAGDADDRQIVIDPIVAWLKKAREG